MLRILSLLVFILSGLICSSQIRLTRQQAITLSGSNRINSDAANLNLLQQQLLLKGSKGFDNPELEYEIDPYDPMVLGVLMPLRLPSVYRTRQGLQKERTRLSELMLQLNQYDVNRLVQNTYNEVQYLYARAALFTQQDSLYQSIKIAAQRNFEAGQINKLEELFAANEANNIRNELERALIELPAQKKALSYILNFKEDYLVDSFQAIKSDPMLTLFIDTISNSIPLNILQQQVVVSQQELKSQKAELLPQINTGPLFGLQNPPGETKKLGWRVSLSIPIWLNQNRARIKAAQTGVQIAEAQKIRQLQDINREYTLSLSQFFKEQKSIEYYTTIAIAQANEITQTALRLFQAGQMNYTETVRNIIIAFQTKINYLEAIRNYNQALIEIKYLNGTL